MAFGVDSENRESGTPCQKRKKQSNHKKKTMGHISLRRDGERRTQDRAKNITKKTTLERDGGSGQKRRSHEHVWIDHYIVCFEVTVANNIHELATHEISTFFVLFVSTTMLPCFHAYCFVVIGVFSLSFW